MLVKLVAKTVVRVLMPVLDLQHAPHVQLELIPVLLEQYHHLVVVNVQQGVMRC